MDAWHRTFDQLRSVVRGLSAAQRISLLVIGLGTLIGTGWLAWSTANPPDEFLLGGRSFSAAELAQTQSALKEAGLTGFRIVGQRISVPSHEVDRYTAAAIARQALPAQFAAEFDRMQSKVTLFTSSEQRRELLEEARKTRLSQILRSIPEIEEAVVEWDRPRQVNLFRPAAQLAAHVSVKPRGGRELSPELVKSLKLFVAGALAGAQTDDVTVVDMNTSRVYGRRSPADVANERVQNLTHQYEIEYSTQITRALSEIPNAQVTVNVQLVPDFTEGDSKRIFSSEIVPVSRRQRVRDVRVTRSGYPPTRQINAMSSSQTQYGTALEQDESSVAAIADTAEFNSEPAAATDYRHSVRVAIAIPDDYYATIARSRGVTTGDSLVQDSAFRGALANIKAETQHKIRQKLVPLLPNDADASAISVTTYTPIKSAAQQTTSATVTSLPASTRLSDWKMMTGIGICGASLVCVAWRFRRNFTASPEPSAAAALIEFADVDPAAETSGGAADSDGEINSGPHTAVLDELAELDRQVPPTATIPDGRFAFLTDLAASDAAQLLKNEHPQTIALVATALAPSQAAKILHSLPELLRWDVTERLTRIRAASPDVLYEVAAGLKSRLHENTSSDGAKQTPAADRDQSHFEQSEPLIGSPLMAQQGVQVHETSWPLTFDDLPTLDYRSLATVLESIDLRACAVGLMDRSESFKQSLYSLMPKHVASAVRQHSRQLGPVRLIEITAAQQAIAGVAWNLSVHGMIALPAHLEHTVR